MHVPLFYLFLRWVHRVRPEASHAEHLYSFCENVLAAHVAFAAFARWRGMGENSGSSKPWVDDLAEAKGEFLCKNDLIMEDSSSTEILAATGRKFAKPSSHLASINITWMNP